MVWVDPVQVEYQGILRLIGGLLDENGASEFSLLQVPGGFDVVYRDRSGETVLQHVTLDGVPAAEAEMAQRRRGRSRDSGTTAGPGYQDRLRAIGLELDNLQAYDLLMRQVGDRIIFTYQYLKPQAGYMFHKALAVMEPGTQEMVVQRAHAHRAPERRGIFRLLDV